MKICFYNNIGNKKGMKRMAIEGISQTQMSKLSPADIKAMIADRNQAMRGYQTGIENPNEKNATTRSLFTGQKDKASLEIADLKEALARAQANPNQALAVNQEDKKGKNLNFMA